MATYPNPWILNGSEFDDNDAVGYLGFVYQIQNKITGRKYIGKKQFKFKRKQKSTGKRKTIDSDWKDYWGSCEPLLDDITKLGVDNFSREIIHLCATKKSMSFHEQKEQWSRDVLRTDEYYNTNIGGKFFVRERHLYYVDWPKQTEYEITSKNDAINKLKSMLETGEIITLENASALGYTTRKSLGDVISKIRKKYGISIRRISKYREAPQYQIDLSENMI